MKQVMKAIAACILPICMILAVVHYGGRLFRPLNTDLSFNTIDTFHSLPKDSVEVIVYGSSHAHIGVNVMEMYERYGIGAYNYGNKWQNINTTALFVQDSLRTQSPKVALIETYHVNDLRTDIDMNGEIYYTRAIPFSDAKKRYLEQCFGGDLKRYLAYYEPFIAFHKNWDHLQKGSFLANSDRTDFYKTMGYWRYKDKVMKIHIEDPRTYEQKALSKEAVQVLDQIVEACNAAHTEVIFYTAPYEAEYHYFDALEQYAQEHGCTYIDLFEKMDEIGIDCDTDFCDKHHMTISGATKVADYLGRYIVENYDVTDMRKIDGNLWEKNR